MTDTGLTIDDDLFDALADVHRRQLLLELLYREYLRVSRLTGIARQIADADDGLLQKHLSGPRHIPEADETLVRTHHVHLPKLVEYDLIEWDRDEHVVTRGPRFEDARPFLEVLESERDDRPPEVVERRVPQTR